MADTETLKTREMTIQGVVFEIVDVMKEGDVLTAGQAYALNQTRAENLRNNFAAEVRKAKEAAAEAKGAFKDGPDGKRVPDIEQVSADDLDVDELQAKLDKYANDYAFTVGGVGGARAPKDPVEREAISMAKDVIKTAYRAKGWKQPDAETLNSLVEKLLDKDPSIREKAKARVDEVKSIDLAALGV